MISRIHQKLGTAGFVISIVALVAALCGGAYAAGGGLTGKQKKEVTKIAKKYAGKPGAPGAAGSQGPAGAAGTKGDKGDKGEKGDTGGPGAPGADGKSVETIPIGTGQAACSGNGGTELEVEGSGQSEQVCNGSPWTAGGTLPSGATETGTWSASGLEGGEVWVPISFPIPLESESSGETPALLVPADGEGFCTGTNIAPTAPAGKLCLYKSQFSGATSGGIWDPSGLSTKVGVSGALLILEGLTSSSQAFGTWAVTAP